MPLRTFGYTPPSPDNMIYVAKSGSDNNRGTFDEPFLTITAAYAYAVENYPPWPTRVVVSVAPGLYPDEHIGVDGTRYRIHITGNSLNLDGRERDVVIANLGTDADHYPLAAKNQLNINHCTIATMSATYDDYVPGIFGTIMSMSQFSNCTFQGGYFVEQEDVDAVNSIMNFDGCFFNGDAFKLSGIKDKDRFIALRACDLSWGSPLFESTGLGGRTVKMENTMLGGSTHIKGDWDILCQWSELYRDGKFTFDTNGYVDIFSSIILNGIHFVSDTPETKKIVNCVFKKTLSHEGDITANVPIEFIEYSGNHQYNGVDGEVITVSKIKNVGGGQNKYRNIHEAIKGSTLTDTIINLESDIEIDTPLIIPPNVDIQIDGSKKWKLTSTHATTLVELGSSQSLSFVNLRQVLGGKKAIVNGGAASLSFVSCGRYTEPCYVNLEINSGNIGSFLYSVKATIIGTGAPAVKITATGVWFVVDRTFLRGSSGQPAIEWTVNADLRTRIKQSTMVHGSGGSNSPLKGNAAHNVIISMYSSAMNAAFPVADFTNNIGSPNNTIDSAIDY